MKCSCIALARCDKLITSITGDHNHARSRRNLIQFYKMIDCATSNDPLKYNHYGCYCGLGGEGTPVDGLDR